MFFLASCKKETGETPAVVVVSPPQHSLANAGDTLQVSGEISSEAPLTHIKIVLLTENRVQACPSVTLHPGTGNYSLSAEYVISNPALESGVYYLLVEAANEFGVTSRYVELNISGIPKESRSLIVFCHEKANDNVKIFKVDSLLNYTLFKQLPYDFREGAVDSKDQQIYSMGQYAGDLYTLDASDGEIISQINAVNNPPFPYFESVFWGNDLLIVGYYDGLIQGYYGNGNLKFSYTIDNVRLHHVCYDGTYLLCVFEYYTGGTFMTGAVYANSGMVKDIIATPYQVAELFRATGNEVLLFCNNGTQPSVRVLDTYTMVITHLSDLPAGKIYGVARIDNDLYIVSHNDGLLIYSRDANDYAESGNASSFGDIVYDETDNIVYMAEGKNINAYSYPGGSLIGTVAMPDSVKDLKILYNR